MLRNPLLTLPISPGERGRLFARLPMQRVAPVKRRAERNVHDYQFHEITYQISGLSFHIRGAGRAVLVQGGSGPARSGGACQARRAGFI